MKQLFFVFFALLILSGADKTKPKVLIIGDSISLGYTPFVSEMLEDEAIVIHNPGNAQYSGHGLANLDEWLGNEKWDVIQFNWGLWDLYGWRYKDTVRTPETYSKNLEKIVTRLEKTNAKLIWVTTTPVCPDPEVRCKLVIDSEMQKNFREAALRVMKKHKIQVNDLYTFIKPQVARYSLGKDNVHYTPQGYRALARQVVAVLRPQLK